ncbi:hypothetical protein EGW08_000074 [Elysia chlorotica]|uniref:Uncharacterized protein n=1 Tax=Elysia chlorotica TaxID=188477 RepID=A0A3S1A2J5_ELYCH|nr:hypothetical protein EGW08_000074 [Elysia chlorotica]
MDGLSSRRSSRLRRSLKSTPCLTALRTESQESEADIPVIDTAVEDGPDLSLFRTSRLQGRPSREEATLDTVEYPSDEDVRESGAGILEFTPAKAGLDMTPANYDFETRDDKKRNATGLSNFAAGALSSVSNTLMHVVSKGYEGNKRSQETAPLLQDQNASPEAHAKTTPVSSVPKSTSSVTLPVSSTSSYYSQYEDQHGGYGVGGHTSMVATVHPFSQSEVPQTIPSSPLQVERRLNELSKQLTRLEHKMSSDIALILHVLQAQGSSSQVTSPSTPPPPPPRMVEADTFPGSSGEYSNVYNYPPPPSHLPPPPSSEALSTIDSDLTWLPHESSQDPSSPPPYPASSYHSATHTSPRAMSPVSPLRAPAVPPQPGHVPPISSCPPITSHQLPADSQTQTISQREGQPSNVTPSVPSQDPVDMVGFAQRDEHLGLSNNQSVYQSQYEPMILSSGEGDSLLQAEQGTYRGQSGDPDDVSDTLV